MFMADNLTTLKFFAVKPVNTKYRLYIANSCSVVFTFLNWSKNIPFQIYCVSLGCDFLNYVWNYSCMHVTLACDIAIISQK